MLFFQKQFASGVHKIVAAELRDCLASLAFLAMELETNVDYKKWKTEVTVVPRTVRERYYAYVCE